MPPIDSTELAYGIPLIVIVPAIVQGAQANGLPPRLAGPAARVAATALVSPGDIALRAPAGARGRRLAGWRSAGIADGPAAAGVYGRAPSGAGAVLRSGDQPGLPPRRGDPCLATVPCPPTCPPPRTR